MHIIQKITVAFLLAFAIFSCCKSKGDDDQIVKQCNTCGPTEKCINGICTHVPGYILIGNQGIQTAELFLGIIPNHYCVDSFVVGRDKLNKFYLITNGRFTKPLFPPDSLANGEYLTGAIEICEDAQGNALGVSCNFWPFRDSIQVKLKFFNDISPGFVDSMRFTCFRL